MSFYSDMAAMATSMLSTYGRNVTLRSYSVSGDAWNPTRTGTDTTVKAVFVNYTSREIDGSLVLTGDKKAFIDSDTAPAIDDSVIDGSTTYRIINFETVAPGDTTILYKLQLRA